jgi:hypothetical protein
LQTSPPSQFPTRNPQISPRPPRHLPTRNPWRHLRVGSTRTYVLHGILRALSRRRRRASPSRSFSHLRGHLRSIRLRRGLSNLRLLHR